MPDGTDMFLDRDPEAIKRLNNQTFVGHRLKRTSFSSAFYIYERPGTFSPHKSQSQTPSIT